MSTRTLLVLSLTFVSLQSFASSADFQCFPFQKEITFRPDGASIQKVYINDHTGPMCEYCSGQLVVATTDTAQSALDGLPRSGKVCMKGEFDSEHKSFFADEIKSTF